MKKLLELYFRLIKQMFPVNAHTSVIGVEADALHCRAVEVALRKGEFSLVRWSLDPVTDGDEKAALGHLAAAYGLAARPRPVVTSLGGKGTLARYVDLPKMAPDDLRRTIAVEPEKYFPFPKDSVHTDGAVLESPPSAKKMSVLVAAIKKDVLDVRLKLFRESGLDPAAISINSVAVANAFSVFPPKGITPGEVRACAVIDIGEAGTNLMILSGGSPRFNRDIFIGVQEIHKRVTNMAGIPAPEARALLAPGSVLPEPARKGVEAAMAGLVAEIRLSFDYFVTEKNIAVSAIYLVGDGSVLPGVSEIFAAGFNMPVTVWDPFSDMSSESHAKKEGLAVTGPRLVTALGLALNEYDQT